MEINQAQKEAILHKDGPMIVLAGPGSGKTFVITKRIKYLIEEHKVPQDEILVITFTKAAAVEMEERFLGLIDDSYHRVSFGTFHSVFFNILKYAYGYNGSNIIRADVKTQYFREIIRKLELEYDDEKEFISDISSEISLVKGEKIDPQNYYSINCGDEVFREIYKEYDNKLRRANLIDFDDMLLLTYDLLSKRKDILSLWQDKFKYILIDEFQDINKIQYEIISMLALPQNNLFIVGDDDQSIYRFRGAKPEIMLEFEKKHARSKSILLDVNYRSTATIIESAHRLVSINKNRFSKKIKANKDKGKEIDVQIFESLSLENLRIVDQIKKYNNNGIMLSDMAILVRVNRGNGSLIHKLMEYNIPFIMKDNMTNIFDHWITKDIISYIDIAMGSTKRSDYLKIINRPKRYISRDCFDEPNVELMEIKKYFDDKYWMLERLDKLEYDLKLLSKMSPYAAINYIRRGISYDEYLDEYALQRRISVDELKEVLDELQEGAKEFKTFEEWFVYMEEYKDELSKQAVKVKDEDAITITTMHGSKGLEFSVVFIVDVNEGISPHKKAVLEADIEEERRLFYVAMTRAKESLHIYAAKERYNKQMKASRFIEELQGRGKTLRKDN